MYAALPVPEIYFFLDALLNLVNPEFIIVIFIHYKPRIALAL